MIRWFTDKAKARDLLGSTVTCFLQEGCMAHDDQFQWIGQVVSVQYSKNPNMKGFQEVKIKILKNNKIQGDIRDQEIGIETIIVENRTLQKIQDGVFFYYK